MSFPQAGTNEGETGMGFLESTCAWGREDSRAGLKVGFSEGVIATEGRQRDFPCFLHQAVES
jgi:hypothetical protein